MNGVYLVNKKYTNCRYITFIVLLTLLYIDITPRIIEQEYFYVVEIEKNEKNNSK